MIAFRIMDDIAYAMTAAAIAYAVMRLGGWEHWEAMFPVYFSPSVIWMRTVVNASAEDPE